MKPTLYNVDHFDQFKDYINLAMIVALGGLAVLHMLVYIPYGVAYVAESTACIIVPGFLAVKGLIGVYRMHLDHLNEQITKTFRETGKVSDKEINTDTCIWTYLTMSALVAMIAPIIFGSLTVFSASVFSGVPLSWVFVDFVALTLDFFKFYVILAVCTVGSACTLHLLEYSRHNSFNYNREG